MQLHFPPKYVLDEMQMYEVRAVMKYQHLAHKDDWEQARVIAFVTAQCNTTKNLNPSDVVRFYWEKEEESDTSISNEDMQRLREKAKQYMDLIKD